ncbi:MAG: hypothetical protein QOE97_1655 [Pseudonocardiales bacterium]|jgi:hypothetical protein|nr:hypothetical protein [Pseudonocardiales bacterium]
MSSEHLPETPAHGLAAATPAVISSGVCRHIPACPSAEASDRDAAHVVAAHPEQGWSLLCNGIVLFEDFGELLPNGESCAARRRELTMASPHRQAS